MESAVAAVRKREAEHPSADPAGTIAYLASTIQWRVKHKANQCVKDARRAEKGPSSPYRFEYRGFRIVVLVRSDVKPSARTAWKKYIIQDENHPVPTDNVQEFFQRRFNELLGVPRILPPDDEALAAHPDRTNTDPGDELIAKEEHGFCSSLLDEMTADPKRLPPTLRRKGPAAARAIFQLIWSLPPHNGPHRRREAKFIRNLFRLKRATAWRVGIRPLWDKRTPDRRAPSYLERLAVPFIMKVPEQVEIAKKRGLWDRFCFVASSTKPGRSGSTRKRPPRRTGGGSGP